MYYAYTYVYIYIYTYIYIYMYIHVCLSSIGLFRSPLSRGPLIVRPKRPYLNSPIILYPSRGCPRVGQRARPDGDALGRCADAVERSRILRNSKTLGGTVVEVGPPWQEKSSQTLDSVLEPKRPQATPSELLVASPLFGSPLLGDGDCD